MSSQIINVKNNVDKDKRFGICGATTTEGGICNNHKGLDTDHDGEGRCYWHEDRSNHTPVKMYEIPALQDRMAFYLQDNDIYSLDREIALNRAYLELFDKHILMFKDFNPSEMQELGISFDAGDLTRSIVTITKNIAKLIQTKHEIEVGRKYVIDVKIVQVIMGVIGEAIDKEVLDPDVREAITGRLNRISLPVASQ